MTLATILAFFQAILKALGLVKDAMPTESEKEERDKAELDKEIEDADRTGGPSG